MKKYILIALVCLFASSCSEDLMDEINKDTNNPPAGAVPAKLQITDAIMSSAFTTSSGAYAWYLSSFTEQEFGAGNNQLMKTEMREKVETAAATTYNNEWNGTYSNLRNLKEIMDKCEMEGNEAKGALDLLAMAQLLTAHNYGILTDLHGDIPCTEALQGQANLQPKVDKQEDIYNNTVLSLIDKSIANFKAAIGGKMSNVGSQDILYGNDNKKWLASAYALKARYLLHTSYRNTAVYSSVIEAANNAITNGFEGMDLNVFDGRSASNPWWSFYGSREYTGVTTTVVNLLQDRNDVRKSIYAFPYYYFGSVYEEICKPGDGNAAVITGGLSQPAWLAYKRTQSDPVAPNGGAAPIHILSKSELYFMLAEAQVRVGGNPSPAFATAVAASFADYERFGVQFEAQYNEYVAKIKDENEGKEDKDKIIPVTYSAFFDTQVGDYIKSLDEKYNANPLGEIMVQKYLSQCRDEQIETYNDIRRCKALGESHITLTNPKNSQGSANLWPERLPYGNSSVTANPAIKALYGDGNYVFTEKVWLFGGSR